ncbi:signal recognition particle-docking protein FtsY [Brachybacterium sp. HMSC06H03]|uniref:signal recognition particle-docking protein FtsY n=1 Tax=Brachybacterium sp. HMSC06H03 TaxID=1581127 RepID=UPI0008A137EF|nr:signal recognition particle-docking protein FtsY [Brachybacterium sp. HMSC06H03]OFT60004.1 signal recognition particle-docking protein FtsY [Brachybacterium sp. HMSC06H03]
MDPDALLALIAGGGGGVVVLGVGAWAYIRSRGRSSSSKDRDEQRGNEDSSRSEPGSTTGTATAVKERPAAPTWADTLSAPTPKTAERPAAGEQAPDGAAPAEKTAPAEDVPFDQEAPEAPAASAPADAPAGTAPADTAGPGTAEPGTAESDTAGTDTAAPTETAPTETAQAGTAQPEAPAEDGTATAPAGPVIETPEAPESRMLRLRERLSRSGALGRGILTLLTRSTVDEETWDEIEETLLMADLGPAATDEMLENLKRRIQVLGTDDVAAVREVLREELVALVDPDLDRRLAATRRTAEDGTEVPSVLLMVGVNGTGKTTTVGKLARVLVAADRTVVLGAADTFRAAAADQLETWGSRVGVDTVRADRDGADPAAVAFDAVKKGIEQEVDVVIIDTAGRLQNKKGLMDELGKVRRVAEKGLHGDEVAEVLLVIDATTGQNGMQQARVFSEAVNITGIVLTKLDGTAKGGIVVNVQRELGVPVKMVGLGEGMDDLTPFDPHGFVDALLEA